MVSQSVVRLAPLLEAGHGDGNEDAYAGEVLNGLLHGSDKENFPGLLGLLSFGLPKDVEDQQVQSPSAQLAGWASKVLLMDEGYDLSTWLEEGLGIL